VNRRLLPLTGPLFFVLFFVALFVVDDDGPGDKASGKAVVDYVDSHEGALLVGAFGGPLLATLLVLFFSHLRTVARERSDTTGAGPTVMVGGAVLWAAGLLLGSMLDLAVVDAANDDQEQVAQTLSVFLNASWLPFIAGTAITLIGAGMTVLRTGVVVRWLGWVALVVGIIGLAGPGGFACFFAGPLFMLVAGILLLMRQDEPASLGAGATDV
jgi:hypothetical protein